MNNNALGNQNGKKCFIITPIGEKGEDTFIKITGIIETIRPIIEEYGFTDIKAAHEICDSGMINNQIVNRIIDDDLVVANLTSNNPNVMYELCLRHVIAKPIIHICETGTKLPFDVFNSRTIFYDDNAFGMLELKRALKAFLKVIDYNKKNKDNPIYTAMSIKREILPEKADYQIFLLKKILERLRGVNFNLDGDIFECLDFRKTPAVSEITVHFSKGYQVDWNKAITEFDNTLKELSIEFVEEKIENPWNRKRMYRTFDNSWGDFLATILMELSNKYSVETYVTVNTIL